MPLSALDVDRAKPADKPYKLRDGKGLYLEVRPTGAKFWRYRFRLPGAKATEEKTFTIGEHGSKPGQFTLAAARDARIAARAMVKQGINPTDHRGQAISTTVAESKNTLRAVALEWLEDNRRDWSPGYIAQVEDGLNRVILPALGDRGIRSITSSDVLAMLKPWKKKPAMGLLIQQWTGAICRYAIAHQRADTDPTYAVRGTIKRGTVKHHSPLAISEVPAFLKALDAFPGQRTTAIALRLLLLTFVRPVELREAKWTEFDLDGAMWKVPAERMKMRQVHYVPLSAQALALLRELHTLTGWSESLFPGRDDPMKFMDHGTLNRAINSIGYAAKFSPHGFRATASTALYEMGYRADLVERQLAHAQRNQSRAAYDQAQFLGERTAMMQTYADRIDGQAAKVVPMRKAG